MAGKSGELTVKVVTFNMKAKNDDISESYMLAGGLTDDGQWLDHEYVADLLDSSAPTKVRRSRSTIRSSSNTSPPSVAHSWNVKSRAETPATTTSKKNFHRNQQDRRAVESEGKIREYKAKEKEARKNARGTDDPMQQLKLKKDARKWAERAEDGRRSGLGTARKKMREEADHYLELIEQALKGTQTIEHLFSIRWKVVT
ncbi:MAG: hypothetical protein R2709_14925 [Marmoricola sp.]